MTFEQLAFGIRKLQIFSRSMTAIPLLIPALLWLLFAGKPANAADHFRCKTMRHSAWLALIPLGIITAPVTSFVISEHLNGYSFSNCFLLIPTVLLTAYALTELGVRAEFSGKSRGIQALLAFCLAVVVLASVRYPWKLSVGSFDLIHNPQKINSDVLEIYEVIGDEKAVLPSWIFGQVDEFENDMNPARGMSYRDTSAYSIARAAAKSDSRYAVIQKIYDKPESFERRGYKPAAETNGYVIYEREP